MLYFRYFIFHVYVVSDSHMLQGLSVSIEYSLLNCSVCGLDLTELFKTIDTNFMLELEWDRLQRQAI
jgi:hypothetical protein